MPSSTKKYLIIGGAGFIGSHLADHLASEGFDVLVIDNFEVKKGTNEKVKSFKEDISSAKVKNIFETEMPDVVYYLAGPISLRKNINSKDFDEGLNIFKGFKQSIDYSAAAKSKFIFVSSGGAIYSDADIIPTNEMRSLNPNSPYGAANLLMEKILESCDIDYTIIRFSNIYGPRQWSDGVIPSFISGALNSKHLVVKGDGSQTRDFLYIDDAVSALLKAEKAGNNEAYNVASGKELSINSLIEKIAEILKIKIEVEYAGSQERIKRSALDYSKFKKEFGWEPKVSIETGIKKTADYYGKQIS